MNPSISGARWWSIDFHAHSPESFDFNGIEGSTGATKPTHEEWLLAYMAAAIDGLVVTDHNAFAGIDKARSARESLRATGHEGFREIAIFAGVEITTDAGLHLLAVFDVDTPGETVNSLLTLADYRGEYGGSDSSTSKSFIEVAKIVTDLGGMAIPAHADVTAGFFGHNAASRKAVTESRLVRSVEVVTVEGLRNAKRANWIPILGSDAHFLSADGAPDPDEAKYPGSHFTWIKMERPELEGVRLAISDGTDSVRPSRLGDEDPNSISHSHLQSIQITHSGETIQHDLSPWMNAVIGGRGVGKSTLLELARLVLARSSEIPAELSRDLAFFSPTSPRADENRYWDYSTVVAVTYVKSGREYRVTWSGDNPAQHIIEVRSEEGWVAEEGNPNERFPILVYSQKQIYESAKEPQGLLGIIDSQAGVDRPEWSDRFDQLSAEYRTLASEIVEAQQKITQEARIKGELSDVEAKLAQLASLESSPEAAEFQDLLDYTKDEEQNEALASEFLTALEAALDIWEYDDNDGDRLAIGEEGADLPADDAVPAPNPNIEWLPIVRRLEDVEKARRDVKAVVSALTESATELAAAGPSPLAARLETLTQSFGNDDSETDDPEHEDFAQLSLRKSGLERQIVELEASKAELRGLAAKSQRKLAEVESHRHELTERRKAYIQKLNKADLRLELAEQGDDARLEAELRTILRKPSSFETLFTGESGFRALIRLSPGDPNYPKSVLELKESIKTLRKEGSDAEVRENVPSFTVGARFLTHLETLDLSALSTELELWFPEDRLRIMYKPEGEANFKSLDQGSPGQKTAALLAAILQMGTDPLLLDQPEDDLDNKLIFDLVVKTLRRIKSTRQVIVATHNPNVVVLGDAENVLVMTHGKVPTSEYAGGIQNAAVKAAICHIMEGGRQAFELRFDRLLQ